MWVRKDCADGGIDTCPHIGNAQPESGDMWAVHEEWDGGIDTGHRTCTGRCKGRGA